MQRHTAGRVMLRVYRAIRVAPRLCVWRDDESCKYTRAAPMRSRSQTNRNCLLVKPPVINRRTSVCYRGTVVTRVVHWSRWYSAFLYPSFGLWPKSPKALHLKINIRYKLDRPRWLVKIVDRTKDVNMDHYKVRVFVSWDHFRGSNTLGKHLMVGVTIS